jgi:DNA (cytosine-5)-methyltransferase 1
MKGRDRPAVVDLFCGAGGFALGFHAAGCKVVIAVDIDDASGRTFEENFRALQPGLPVAVFGGDVGDLETFDLDRLASHGRPDILIGGPPCQGFSTLGRAKLDSLSDEGYAGDPRNELYRTFLEAAELWKPLVVVMENVPGMLSVDGKNIATDVAEDLARRGFITGYALMNAVWYGVPQLRERLFFIGVREDLGIRPGAPRATHRATLPAGYVQPGNEYQFSLPFVTSGPLMIEQGAAALDATSVSDAMDDLPVLTEHLRPDAAAGRGDFRRALPYRSAPHSEYARLMRSWPDFVPSPMIYDHAIRRTPRDYETFQRMGPGDRYPRALEIARGRLAEELARLESDGRCPKPATPEYRALERQFVPPYPDDIFVDKWRKLIPEQPSWTVPAHLAKDTYSHIHHDSDQARSISVREAARLQSFPDAFKFTGNMGDCFRQIGNAVPPLMSWAIACSVMELLGLAPKHPSWGASRSRTASVAKSLLK